MQAYSRPAFGAIGPSGQDYGRSNYTMGGLLAGMYISSHPTITIRSQQQSLFLLCYILKSYVLSNIYS